MGVDYPLNIKRSLRRRRIAVSVNSGVVTLHIPSAFPEAEVEPFLAKNHHIVTKLLERESQQLPPFTPKFELEAKLPLLGELYPIKHNNISPTFANGAFNVRSSAGEGLKREIILIYHNIAAEIIGRKTFALSQKHKIHYNSISINSANTRWGSCSSNGDLNFSWKLILCPEPLVDYVIAHELSHRLEMNHSAKFWKCVSQIYPNYKQARQALKEEAIRYRTWK